jgi:hypothetical protein
VAYSGTWLDTEHVAHDDDGPMASHSGTPYWHVQDLVVTELTAVVARGLRPGLGLEAMVPLRHVTTRIRFEDTARRPFLPAHPDIHHRNQTLVGPSDPWLLVHGSRRVGGLDAALRVGLTVPLGRTEENPFRLGDLGLPHQHIQFGTGTWDPVVGLGLQRAVGAVRFNASAMGRFGLAENSHGYRTGHRFFGQIGAERALGKAWRARAGVEMAREEPERWDGVRESEEGNLGRTDVLVALGAGRAFARVGHLHAAVKVPVATRVSGSQIDYPVIFTLGWSK